MKPQADVLAIITAALSGRWTVLGMLIGVALGITGAKRKSRFLVLLGLILFVGTFLTAAVLFTTKGIQ